MFLYRASELSGLLGPLGASWSLLGPLGAEIHFERPLTQIRLFQGCQTGQLAHKPARQSSGRPPRPLCVRGFGAFGASSVVLERLGGILGNLGAILGHLGVILGHLGAILGHLGPTWGRYGGRLGCPKWCSRRGTPLLFASWVILGLSWAILRASWAILMVSWAILRPS